MMPLELAVDALAAYRLTRLAVKDDLTTGRQTVDGCSEGEHTC